MVTEGPIAVVGGGLAGLSAALALKARGREVLLLEAGPTLGGKLQSLTRDGLVLERGPVSFSGKHPELWRLLAMLGLSGEAERLGAAAATRYVVRGGALRGVKPSPLSLVSTRVVTWAERARLVREFIVGTGVSPDDSSVRELFARHFGDGVADGPAAAMVGGIWAGDASTLSAEACFPEWLAAARAKGHLLRGAFAPSPIEGERHPGLYSLRGGLGRIGAAAAEKLSPLLSSPVTTLERRGAGFVVRTPGGRYEVASVVLAAQSFQAAVLLAPVMPRAADLLTELKYAPLTTVHWREREAGESGLPQGFGYLSPPNEGRFALGTVFVGALHGEKAGRYVSFVGGALFPDRAAASPGELEQGVAGDVKALGGGRLGEVLHIERWSHAVFQPELGTLARRAALSQALAGQGVFLAGSYLGASAMKDAVRSGFAAAEAVLARTLVSNPEVRA